MSQSRWARGGAVGAAIEVDDHAFDRVGDDPVEGVRAEEELLRGERVDGVAADDRGLFDGDGFAGEELADILDEFHASSIEHSYWVSA
ncbi:hypothetical protein [Microbacterium sp. SD291]|uniref:hypothetical protein n=1 Tax=Microbacterium sp. SD291 TaxID=2782007 RepID=UPI001A96383C|nr:hypothetical protein [Microbacterium sp. SD291]MBO0979061.1 hypothetical protein [Microbacterium sp. SD291]